MTMNDEESRSITETPTKPVIQIGALHDMGPFGTAPSLAAQTGTRLSPSARLALLAALVFAGLALACNLVLIAALLRVQATVAAGLDRTIGQLEGFCGSGAVPIVFPISQTMPFKGEISLPENLSFPFKGNIPIRTTVRMAIAILPGAPTVEIPINIVVPIDTQVALPGGIRIPIDTEVPIRQNFTVDLCTNGSSFKGLLGELLQELSAVRESMRFP